MSNSCSCVVFGQPTQRIRTLRICLGLAGGFLGAEDQIVIYHFLDGTGGVDPAAAAPGTTDHDPSCLYKNNMNGRHFLRA